MAKTFTNIWFYVIVIFLLVFFISSINILASQYLLNTDVPIDSENSIYAQKILNINLSNYSVSGSNIEKSSVYNQGNETGSQTKDMAIEFFYSRSIVDDVELVVKGIFSFPGYIAKLLNIPKNNIGWILSILNWFWRIAIIIALYYALRGIVT